MLKQWIIMFSIIGCCLGSAETAKANHAMGADLSYRCVDSANRVYFFTLHFYRDCAGVQAPTAVYMSVRSTCASPFTALLNQVPCGPAYTGQPCEVSPVCPAYLNESTCNGGTMPGVGLFVYTGTVTLPAACTNWTFSIDIPARNKATTNLVKPDDEDLYIQVIMNNVLAQNNSSPQFTTSPVPVICVSQPFSYNQGAQDADGDSLVYTLVNPLTDAAQPIAYNAPFTPANPVSAGNTFVFNTTNGQVDFTPDGVQVAVIAMLVEEYRNGQLIGSVMRDMEFVIVNLPGCAEPAPVFTGAVQHTVKGGLFVDNRMIQLCPGRSLSFSAIAYTQSDSVFMSSNISDIIPGANLIRSYIRADSLTGIFTVPANTTPGRYSLVVTVKDNNCPLVSTQSFAITIDIRGGYGVNAGPDVYYCPAAGPVQLIAGGGDPYTWQPATGLNAADISDPVASPAQTTTYIVSTPDVAGCKNEDTITVFKADFDVVVSIPNDTVCTGASVQLTVTGGNTYRWQPADGLSCITCPNPVATPAESTVYKVQVSDSTNGCSVTNEVPLTVVEGVGVTPAYADTTVNGGDTLSLIIAVSGAGPYSYTWSPGLFLDNASTQNPVSVPLAQVTYTIVVSNGACADSATIVVNALIPENIIKVPSAFTPNGDTHNDAFGPVIYNNIGTVRQFRVYNRYGQVVHNSTAVWDGNYSGAEQPTGTYVYYLQVEIPGMDDMNLQGSVTLLR